MNKTDHQKHDNEEEMTPKEVPNQTANQIASSQQPTNHIEASNNGHDIDVMVKNVIKDGGQGNGHNILKNTSPEKTTISSSTSDENIFSRIEVETRSDLIQQTVKQLVQERMEKLENNLFEGFKKELKRINEENVNLKRRERTLKGRIQLLESNLKVSTDKSTNTEECSLIQKMKIGDEKAPTNDQKESENEGDEISISPRTRIDLAEDKILPLTCSPNSSSSLRDENDITPLAPSDDNSTVIEVVETSLSREETKIELENSDELVIDEKINITVKDSSTEESCVEKTLSISDKPMTIERFDKGTTTKENKGTFIEVGDLKPRDEELANQNGAFFRSADQKDDRLTPRDHNITLAKPTNQGIASNESTNEIEDMLSPRISTSTSSITASVETANNNFVPAMFRSLPTMEVKPYQLTTEPERKVDQIVEKYKERNLTADRNPPFLEPSNHNRSYAEASNQNHAFIEPVSQYQPLTRAVNQQPPFSITSINPNVSMDNTPRYRMRGPSKRAASSEVFPEFQHKRKPRVGRPPLNRGPRPRHVVRPHEYQPPWYNRVPATAAQHQRFFEEMRIRHAFELQQSPQFKRLSAKQKAKAYEEMALASMKWEQEFLKQQEHLQRLEMHRSPNGAANARFNFDPGYMQQGAPVECLHPYRNGNPRYPSEEVLISPRRKNPHARFPPEESSVSPANTNTIRQSLRIPEEELLAPQGQKQQNGNPRIPPERILVSPGERTRLIQSSPNSPSLRQQLSPRQSEQRRQDTNNNKLLQTTPDTPIVIHSPTPKQETYTTPQTRPQEKSLHSERPLSPKTKSRKLPIPVPPPLTLHEVTEGHLLTPVHDRRMSADPNMKAQQQNFKLVPVSSSKKNLAQIIRYQQKSQDNRLPTNDDLRNNKAPSRSDYDFPANQDVSRLQPVSVSKIPIPCLLDIDGRPPPTYEETQRARLPNILTELTTDVESGAVVLKWNCTELSQNCQDNVRVYLLFAYHSDNIYAQPPSDIGRWMRIGEVDALPLPIACSLTKTFDGNCYFFTVVPVDKKGVLGTMSNLCVLDVSR